MTEPPADFKEGFIKAEFTEDAVLGGQLWLRQPKSGHRAGHDAILLAAATPAKSGDRVVDFGAGVGAAGLAVARRVADIRLVLVEIDAALADLARGNASANAVSAVGALLDGANIHHLVLDQNMSIIEGSLGVLPRRILVHEDDNREARQLLADAGLGHELRADE